MPYYVEFALPVSSSSILLLEAGASLAKEQSVYYFICFICFPILASVWPEAPVLFQEAANRGLMNVLSQLILDSKRYEAYLPESERPRI